jgi:xylulokinase
VPVVTGAGDTAAALVGLERSGAVPKGAVVVNAGTGIQILRTGAHPSPRTEPLTHLYCDASGGWYEMLAIQNGGFALTWAQRQLSASWDSAVALAREVPPGSRDAVFLPFLTGERGGVATASASAGWRSLTTSTERPELLRAAFEAYAFTVRRGLEVLGSPSDPLVLSGGGGRDPWVRQLLADVLGRPVSYVPLRSASAVGAAVLAARGRGVELDVPATVVRTDPSGLEVRDRLDEAYSRWVAELQAG